MSKKVFIGVGHGGSDPGAVANGLRETDLNLKQALFLEKELVANEVEVRLSRRTNENDDISEEIRECNAYNPDLAIDMHTNSGGGRGFEVFHTKYQSKGVQWAREIDSEIRKAGLVSRGCKVKIGSSGNDYFGFIRSVKAPSIITEMAFIDNYNDIKNFDEDHEIRLYVRCIAKATLRTLGMGYSTSSSSSSNNTSQGNSISSGSSVKVGSKVKIKSSASNYSTGQAIPNWVKQNTYTIMQVGSNKVLLKEIMSWVNTSDVEGVEGNSESSEGIELGARVKIKSSASNYATGQAIPNWVKQNTYTIMQVGSNKVLLREIMSWVYTKDVTLA